MALKKIPLIGKLSQTTAALAIFKLYRLARCHFKIDIKMTSSQYHQGALIVSWLPNVANSFNPTIQQMTGLEHTILSASKQDSLSLTVPYCSPEDWMDTQGFSSVSNEHATVYIAEFNTLLSTNPGIAASIPIDVFGSVEDIDMSGAISQSKRESNKEAQAKEQAGEDQRVGATVRNTSQLVRKIPIIGTVWSPIADVINTIFGTHLSKPVATATAQNNFQQYYGDVNMSEGVTNGKFLSLYQNPRVAVGKTLFGMESTFMSLKKLAGTPMLHDQVVFDGVGVTTWATFLRYDMVGISVTGRDYCATAVRFAKYYRGSLKFMFQFITACFYSARFRLSVRFGTTVADYGNIPSMVFDVKGDTIIKVTIPYLNFRAWSDRAFALGTGHDLDPIIVLEQLTDIVGSPSPTTAVMYVNIFRSAGEDAAFAVPADILDPNVTKARTFRAGQEIDMSPAKVQMNTRKEFSEQFPPLTIGGFFTSESNAVMSEQIDALIDLLKRPAMYGSVPTALGTTSYLSFHKLIMSMFLWWRGSMVMRHMHLGNTTTHNDGWYLAVSTQTTNRIDFGWAPAYATGNQFIQNECIILPWYNAAPYVATAANASIILGSSNRASPVGVALQLATTDTIAVSAGDDFMALFLVPFGNDLASEPKKEKPIHKKS